jgi:hypothetical protein
MNEKAEFKIQNSQLSPYPPLQARASGFRDAPEAKPEKLNKNRQNAAGSLKSPWEKAAGSGKPQ